MHRKRFRVIPDGDKALQPKTTNVRGPPSETLTKTAPGKKSGSSSRKRRTSAAEEPKKRQKQNPSTVFDSEDVQIKLIDQAGRSIKSSEGVLSTETQLGDPPSHGRLTRIDEEDNSLKMGEFDQPPQSTSTPLLRSSSQYDYEQEGSPFVLNQLGRPSLMFYSPGAPQNYGQQSFQDYSPSHWMYAQDPDQCPAQFMGTDYRYLLSHPLPVAQPVEPYMQYSYPTAVRPFRNRVKPEFQVLCPSNRPGYYMPPPGYTMAPHMRFSSSLLPNSGNSTPSYRSTGGETTYRSSEQSSRRVHERGSR